MPIAFRSYSSGTTSCAVPTGVQDGDMLIFFGGYDGTSSPGLPSGFTAIDVLNETGGGSCWLRSAWKIADGESGSYTAANLSACQVLAFSKPADGIWNNPSTAGLHSIKAVSSLSITTNEVTPLNTADMLVMGAGNDGARPLDVEPSGMTKTTERINGSWSTTAWYQASIGTTSPVTKSVSYTVADGITAAVVVLNLANLSGFDNRIRLDIDADKIDSDLTDFPVMIKLGGSVGRNNNDLTEVFDELASDANRKKIAVTTDDGITQCYVEIEYWDDASETAVLWTKIPSIDDTVHTVIYLYYDSTASDNTSYVGDIGDTPAQSVWDDDFIAVYHLAQDPSGTAPQITDSTGNGNHLTSGGTMLTEDLIDSEPGKGIDFDGSDDHLTRTSCPISAYPFTLEAAGPANVVASTNTNPAVSFADNSDPAAMFTLNIYDGYARTLFSTSYYVQGTEQITDDDFVHLAGVHSAAASHHVFTNGKDKVSDTSNSYSFPAGLDRISIGSVQDSTPGYRAGEVSEVRVSDITRTDAWIRASYHSMKDDLIAVSHVFANSIKVTIDNTKVDSTLTDFPVLIVLGENVGNNNKDLTEVFDDLTSDANNKKIKVIDSAGQELFVEIDYWSDANETAFIWVKVPSISSSADTDIYLQYDVNAPDNTSYVGDPGEESASKVWDDNFIIVQHGHATGTINSTNEITPSYPLINSSDEVTGQVGKAIDLDGSTEYFNYGDSEKARITPDVSVEIVFKRPSAPSATEALAGKYSPSSPSEGWIVLMDLDGYMNFDGREGGGYQSSGKISQNWANNAWHYVMGRKTSGGEWFIAADDHTYTSGNSGTGSGAIDANGRDLLIGSMSGVGGNEWEGYMDEVRVSDIPRTNAWSKATYYTIFDNFVAFDAPDAPATGGGKVLPTKGIHSSIFGGAIVR